MNESSQKISRLLADSGAMLQGHFQLSSGLHSGQYLQCALLLAYPDHARAAGEALSRLAPVRPDVVISPALGGIVIGHEVARALGTRALFAERQDGKMTLRRGFALRPGEKALVVEDVITTGKSTGEVISLVRALGGEPIGALSIVCRGIRPPDLGVPLASLLHLPLTACPPQECQLCRNGLPLVKPGSRPSAPKNAKS